MSPDLLHRIRWGNVVRAAVVVAVAALVVAWPHLRSGPPPLPPATPAAIAPTAPEPAVGQPAAEEPPADGAPRTPKRTKAGARHGARSSSAQRRLRPPRTRTPRLRPGRHAHSVPPKAPSPRPAPRPAPAPPAPPPTPAAEFEPGP